MTREDRQIVDGVDLTPGAQKDARGVDLTLVRHCLALTPTERMAENQDAIELLEALERSRHGTG